MERISFLLIVLIFFGSGIAGLFDDRLPSARATAMSGAVVALQGDVWAPYYNPASLSSIDNYQIGGSYQIPYNLSFFRNYFVSGVVPTPYGTAAVSMQNFGVQYQGNDLSSEYTFGISHGFYLMKDVHSSLSAGYNLKYYYWSLSESIDGFDLGSGSTFGLDIGLQGSIYGRTYIGVYALNINTPHIGALTKYELPQRIVAGIAYQPLTDLITAVSFNKTSGFDIQVEGGFEYHIIPLLALRLGASTAPNRFSGGIGLNHGNIRFDYALRTHPVLAETHQFGLSYLF